MFMRIVRSRINPGKIEAFRKFYNEESLPELHKVPGCLCARLIQGDRHEDEYLSMTLWESKQAAEAYGKSDLFKYLLQKLQPYLSESSEWKIQLSQDYSLDVESVKEEPVIQSYPIVAQTDSDFTTGDEAQSMYMRVVSVSILPEKLDEFKQLYLSELIPAVLGVDGCRYAYLAESIKEENEVYSVSIWNSKKQAENYEKSGLFHELTEKVKHTFENLHQWQMILQENYDEKVATDKALKVNYYAIVNQQTFQNF